MDGFRVARIDERAPIHHGAVKLAGDELGVESFGSQVVASTANPLWFLGTLVHLKLTGEQTGGQFALWEGILPRGAAPPLHSHPQDETFYVLEGVITVWVVEPELTDDRTWVKTHAQQCGVGGCVLAPGGTPHAFRVESDSARMLFLSTPAGIEDYVQALAEPAGWPWLPPPPDGPRVPAERLRAVDREHGVIRYSPPPPAADPKEKP
jgi:mannose-6-phosphate isomerase-like protein (cupin superfamily)